MNLQCAGLRFSKAALRATIGSLTAAIPDCSKLVSVLNEVCQSIRCNGDMNITGGPRRGVLNVTAEMYSGRLVNVGPNSLMRHITESIKSCMHPFCHETHIGSRVAGIAGCTD